MEIKVNGAYNWDTSNTTSIKSVQLHILCKVCVQCNHKIKKRKQKMLHKKRKTYRIWTLAREERYLKRPGHSWIFLVSLGGFAMASHSCCTPFECFCFLLGEISTIFAQNALLHKF